MRENNFDQFYKNTKKIAKKWFIAIYSNQVRSLLIKLLKYLIL